MIFSKKTYLSRFYPWRGWFAFARNVLNLSSIKWSTVNLILIFKAANWNFNGSEQFQVYKWSLFHRFWFFVFMHRIPCTLAHHDTHSVGFLFRRSTAHFYFLHCIVFFSLSVGYSFRNLNHEINPTSGRTTPKVFFV